MEQIRQVAVMCVGRAVFFGSLAIGSVMVGCAYNPALAFRAGAITTLLMAGVLTWKALTSGSQKPRRTEVWLYLDEQNRPGTTRADEMFAAVMRDVYVGYARIAFFVACGFFAVSMACAAIGFEPYSLVQASPS